jgi:hypothetical protein
MGRSFRAEQDAKRRSILQFGAIKQTAAGDYLLSIHGKHTRSLRDFTVPINRDAWASLLERIDDLGDSEVPRAILGDQYLEALRQRTGQIPEELGAKLRRLVVYHAVEWEEDT